MRMKKILMFAAVLAVGVSCAKISQVAPVSNEGGQIGFGTWSAALSRARTQGTSTFASGDDLAVYGYKDKSTPAPATVFDDVVVSYDGSDWTYSTPRFWDSNYDKYVFYAISPAVIGTQADGSNSSTDVDPQDGTFVTRAITFAGNDNDILVADEKTVNKTDGGGSFNGYATVPLVFNHVAAKVDFKVKKAPSLHDATVTVSAFELSDIDNVGQLTVASYSSTHPVPSWSGTARTTYGPGSGVTPVSIASPITIAEDTGFSSSNTTANTDPAGSTTLINNLIVLPQTFRASGGSNPQKITLTYKIAVDGSADTEFEDCVLYLYDFDNTDNAVQTDTKVASWEPGKYYTFYITIDANKIDFSASITDWTAVSGYHYLAN